MKMICISSMGESAQSYVESTTVLSDYWFKIWGENVRSLVSYSENDLY